MNHSYRDITSRIAEEPKWYDENGTPRYEPFAPALCPSIYAEQVILLRIACQDCGRQFDVELSGSVLCPLDDPQKLHYGDPPAHGCVGDTMNCVDLAVLQVWDRRHLSEWKRRRKLEGTIDGR